MYKTIRKYLGQSWEDYRRVLEESLGSDIKLLSRINGYMLEHSGKQIRPTLTLLTAKALRGFCSDDVIRTAAAVELLHTATLMHDDVADNSPLRHGIPTLLAKYGQSEAVLTGDYWLSRALHIIIDHPDKRVFHRFAQCLEDLACGEMIQLEKAASLDTTEADYMRIICCKTTTLFESSALGAAYSVGASPEEIEMCRQFAFHLGNSFQMMDDIFDYSPAIDTGKPSGQDIREKKITLPVIGALAAAPKKEARAFLKQVAGQPSDIANLALQFVQNYGGLEFARTRLDAEVSSALAALSLFPESEAKDYLESITESMSTRTF